MYWNSIHSLCPCWANELGPDNLRLVQRPIKWKENLLSISISLESSPQALSSTQVQPQLMLSALSNHILPQLQVMQTWSDEGGTELFPHANIAKHSTCARLSAGLCPLVNFTSTFMSGAKSELNTAVRKYLFFSQISGSFKIFELGWKVNK